MAPQFFFFLSRATPRVCRLRLVWTLMMWQADGGLGETMDTLPSVAQKDEAQVEAESAPAPWTRSYVWLKARFFVRALSPVWMKSRAEVEEPCEPSERNEPGPGVEASEAECGSADAVEAAPMVLSTRRRIYVVSTRSIVRVM